MSVIARRMFSSLKHNALARRFFFAHAQSTIGDQLGYIGLVVVATQLSGAAFLTAVLMAELLPSVLFGARFGAMADALNRRSICVAADLARAIAFGVLVFVDAPALVFGAALVGGVGSAAFGPSSLAALPTIVAEGTRVQALALHGFITSIGVIAGPLLAAALLLLASTDDLFALNAVTFLVSAGALMLIPRERWGGVAERMDAPRRTARLRSYPASIRLNVVATASIALFAGMVGVAEVVLATRVLDVGGDGLALLIAAYGIGFSAAYPVIARTTSVEAQWMIFVGGAAILGLGLGAAALAPSLPVALVAFVLAGTGNGLAVASARVILQETTDPARLGGIYGIKDSLDAGAVALSLLAGGAIVTLSGARAALVVAAAGCIFTGVAATRQIAMR